MTPAAKPIPAPIYRGESLKLADGTTIAYYVRPGTGPSLVLVPGSWGDYRVFDGVVSNLPRNFQIVVVELRGHGRSRPPVINGSIELLADDVLRVVKQLKPTRYYVGGHSIGGMIAIDIAGRHPDGLAGVISMEGWTHWQVQKEAFGGEEQLAPNSERQKTADEIRTRVQSKLTQEQIDSFETIWKHWDGSRILETTPLPILEIWGDRGLPRPSRSQLRIPARANINLVWLPRASHDYLIDRSGEVAMAINEFVTRTAGTKQ